MQHVSEHHVSEEHVTNKTYKRQHVTSSRSEKQLFWSNTSGATKLRKTMGEQTVRTIQVKPTFAALQSYLDAFVLHHSPDQLMLVVNEPRSKGGALDEEEYLDLEALAFPKVIQDGVTSEQRRSIVIKSLFESRDWNFAHTCLLGNASATFLMLSLVTARGGVVIPAVDARRQRRGRCCGSEAPAQLCGMRDGVALPGWRSVCELQVNGRVYARLSVNASSCESIGANLIPQGRALEHPHFLYYIFERKQRFCLNLPLARLLELSL